MHIYARSLGIIALLTAHFALGDGAPFSFWKPAGLGYRGGP